ncbi:MAG: hypothetical protein FGM15_07710 [Chthoniobacterales bacterium]|nr:hypothetical protein [Chthoniobacterales bacterium]
MRKIILLTIVGLFGYLAYLQWVFPKIVQLLPAALGSKSAAAQDERNMSGSIPEGDVISLRPRPVQPPLPRPITTSKRVSLAVKRSARSLFEEWKARELVSVSSGNVPTATRVSGIVPEDELAEIRRSLFFDGIYSEQAFRQNLIAALLELGVSQSEVSEIANEITEMRSKAKTGNDESSGMREAGWPLNMPF